MHTTAASSAVAPVLAAALLGLTAAAPPPGAAEAAITRFDQAAINVILTGDGQSPGVVTAAAGECAGRLDPQSGRLALACSSDVAGAGEVIITLGPPAGGGVDLFDLGGGAVTGAELILTEDQVAALLTGELYVAVTSPAHPRGEVAARLVPRTAIGEQFMRFPLRGDSLVATASDARANCALAIDAGHTRADLLCRHDVANAKQLRVLIDGNVVATVNDVASPFEASLPALVNQYNRFLAGDFGLVLTSQGFPQGELGMVLDHCIEGPSTLCVTGRRFRASVELTAPQQSARLADAVPARSQDAGLFWFFNPANWEVLVKVLDACDFNGRFWVFLSANTNVAFKATVFDTLTGATRVYSNPQGKVAAPVADTDAFACH